MMNLKQISRFFLFLIPHIWNVHGDSEIQFKSEYHLCSKEERSNHPHLCNLLDRARIDPVDFANELHVWANEAGLIFNFDNKLSSLKETSKHSATFLETTTADNIVSSTRFLRNSNHKDHDKEVDALGESSQPISNNKSGEALPTVLAHGMGDSCFNSGFQQFTNHISTLTSSLAICIPTGQNQHQDTMNGYFLNMDASVDIFAAQIRANEKLKDGFNAVGLSQGNNVIRGYIARYNDPPVNTFLSINGVNGGVGAVPFCQPKSEEEKKKRAFTLGSSICDGLMEIASHKAYTTFSQTHSFQANYWRDPRPEAKERYATYSQLAQWNNEGLVYNSTLNENYAKTNKFVWVMALEDRIVWPKEGEQWGAPNPLHPFDGTADSILDRKDTEWYIKDSFGLRTAEEEGKNFYESFDGPHLGFDMKQLDEWVMKYLN